MTVIRHPNNQGVTLQQWRKTAAGGETSLSGTDDFSAGLAYTVGAEEVFINGVLIERGVDYTATSGTAITLTNALVAGDLATVQSATYFNVANAIPKATVTAKGDVIVGTGASTVTNLAVGADGTTLVANSSASTGVSWSGPTFVAGRNKILNGDFAIWQRGTSLSGAGYFYGPDRFGSYGYSGASSTLSQQAFTAGSAPVAGYESNYYCRINSTNTATVLYQKVEDVRTFANQTVTLSFWAKVGSASTGLVQYAQNFGSGGSSTNTVVINNAISFTTSWQRFSFTFTPASVSGKTIGAGSNLEIDIYAGSINNNFDIWGVQLEAGSVATPFTTATGTLQGELAAAQRYYWRSDVASGYLANYSRYGLGLANSTTKALIGFPLKVTMRVGPTVLDYSALSLSDGVTTTAVTSAAIDTSNPNYVDIGANVASGLVTYRPYELFNFNAASYIGFSAEL